jgi:CRP/FNR family transcriptional regulator
MTQGANGGITGGLDERELVARLPFLEGASTAVRREIAAAGSVVQIPREGYFLREGESCAQFAIVLSGRLRVFKLGEGGQEITLYHVRAGEACPLNVSCILSDRPVPAMARAEEDVEALVIPAKTFRRWMSEFEALRTFIFHMFAERLTEVMSLVEEVAFRKMDQRLAGYLDDLFEREGTGGSVDVTHARIASDLGTAREVVSRLLKEFERMGAIELSRGHIVLRRRGILHAWIGREPSP